ncbi:MAG: methyltransferase domain-containing protein [Caldilineaceae bacterium]|nr:methyltransferase domain-containing protein [Caldilineaceae bacterium]
MLQTLRQEYSGAEAGALVTLARLRQRAATKFPKADQLFFTPEALEQATAWPIAQRRARTFAEATAQGPVLDLGCGIGGDLLALAQQRPVIGIDLDPVRLQFAAANAEILGVAERIRLIEADWTVLLHEGRLPAATAAFADPARRVDGKRIFHLQELRPPLAELLAVQQQIKQFGVKVMPGVDTAELPPDCGVEFISHEGVCKEAVLWFGGLAPMQRWASVFLADNRWQMLPADEERAPVGGLEGIGYLHEPDPAIIRAGAIGQLCQQLDAYLFDPQIAYLVSPVYHASPLVQSFRIEEIHPFQLKLLNRRLQALGIGQVELKKRGFPTAPEALRPRLKVTPGGRAGVVIFSRRGEERLMLIGERVR